MFANWTILSLEEVLISKCRSSSSSLFVLITKLNDRCFDYFTGTISVSLGGEGAEGGGGGVSDQVVFRLRQNVKSDDSV